MEEKKDNVSSRNSLKVPKLRFKDENGNEYPAPDMVTLGTLCEEINRKAPIDSTVPVMMISSGNGFIYQNDRYSRDNAGSSLKNYTLLRKGEMAYNHGYSKLRPFGSVYPLTEETEARIPYVYHSFRMNNDNSDYYGFYLNSGLFDKDLKKLVSSTARMDGLLNISYNDYMTLKVMHPSIFEQEKVAAFMQFLTTKVKVQEELVALLKKYKKGLLSKMFPKDGAKVPEIRFKGAFDENGKWVAFDGEWEEKHLCDISTIVGGGTPDTKKSEYWDGDIEWYAPAEIQNQRYVSNSARKITLLGLQRSSAKILPAEKTVLFTSRAGIGKMAILKKDSATNQGFQSMILNDGIDTYFVYSMKELIKKSAEKVASGSTFAEISGKALGELSFMFPESLEQRFIGMFFKTIDDRIETNTEILYTMKELKKSLLQQMFC